MHMLQAGLNLIYIRDFLGHVDVKTTETYAKADVEAKRTAIESVCDVCCGAGAEDAVILEEQKETIKKEILLAGEPFSYEVKLLITVRGITPLSALAF